MNKDINEKISLFLDDELDSTELDSLLSAMKQYPDLKTTIYHYQAIGQVLKTDEPVMPTSQFLEGIQQELKHEPHYLLPKKANKKEFVAGWQKVSLALAASVAVVAVTFTQYTSLSPVLESQQGIVLAEKQTEETSGQKVADARSQQHERFKAYLQAHSNDLYTHGSLDIQSVAQVASFQGD